MANETINDQSALTSLATDDTIPVWDTSAAAMKKITFANFLTGSFDLGAGNYLAAGKVRASSATGLRIEDDGGVLGIFVQDATGFVGIGNAAPTVALDVTGAMRAAFDTNAASYFGRARVGYDGTNTDMATFQHLDVSGNGFAVAQSTVGATILNAASGQTITFGIANVAQGTLDATNGLRVGYDTDKASFFGRARIGYDGAAADWASFSHVDHPGGTAAALWQSNLGATWLNTISGQAINFGIAGSSQGTLDATNGLRIGYDTNKASAFGRAIIGYNGSTSDWASFSHVDMTGASNMALIQSAGGETWLNCSAANNMVFARGGFALGYWDTSGNLIPAGDNLVDCGKSGARWNDIWAANATIQTSDERDKNNISASALGLDFILALEPISWVWANREIPARTRIDLDEDGNEIEVTQPAVKLEYARPHYGLVAQQVKAAMNTLGIADFAGYIYDPEADSYALRYNEFIAPIIKAIQELTAKIAQIKGVA